MWNHMNGINGMNGVGFPWGLIGGIIMMILLIVLVVAAIFWLFKTSGGNLHFLNKSGNAFETARQRYARGEITREEFFAIKQDLEEAESKS